MNTNIKKLGLTIAELKRIVAKMEEYNVMSEPYLVWVRLPDGTKKQAKVVWEGAKGEKGHDLVFEINE